MKKTKNYKLKTKSYKLKTKKFKISVPHLLSFSFYLLSVLSFSLKAQTQTQNYIYVQEPTDPVSVVESGTKAIRTVQYFDGLGRPKQAIQVKATPDKKNIVVKTEYDGFGRQALDYLPVPVSQSSLSYISEATVNSAYTTFYGSATYDTEVFFSEKTFEDSPLNRVLKQAAPGDDWAEGAGHEIEFQYRTNFTNEVMIYWVDGNGNLKKENYRNNPDKDFYEPNTLYKTVTTDENNNPLYEYKDKQGRVVMKRAKVAAGNSAGKNTDPGTEAMLNADTYYVYDIYGNLAYVIPPLASARSSLTATYISNLCYQYKYDERNRLVEKKLPGKEAEFMVYDKQDRLVATQDPNLGLSGQWLFTKYDKFGRVVYTGIYNSSATRSALQQTVNGFGSNNEARNASGFTQNGLSIKYTKTAFPASFDQVLTVNYYDNYTSLGFTKLAEFTLQPVRDGSSTPDNSLQGLPVASFLRIPGTTTWEQAFTVYDKRSRAVGTYKYNHLGGFTKTESRLDFRGKPEYTITKHSRATASAAELTITDTFTYDHMERLTKHTQQVNSGPVQLIALNSYDKLGQLTGKKVGGTASNASDRWQDIEYKYNIRGWLTDINNVNIPYTGRPGDPGEPLDNDDLFTFRIAYNQVYDGTGVEPLYNGNIAQTFWKTSADGIKRSYDYTYDQLNRLRKADFYKTGANPFTGAYGEYLAYDLNGNILNLIRYTGDAAGGQIDMDDLAYTYMGGSGGSNRLMRVEDGITAGSGTEGFVNGNTNSDDYAYDDNGNMTKDKNKAITAITYNYLNLPTEITWTSTKKIQYLYNAAGQKVQKKVTEGSNIYTTEYLDGFQYYKGVLQFFPHAEGYVKNTVLNGQNTYDYVYNYTDHLGNIRVSYTKDPETGEIAILEENHYYPFGLKHSVYADNKNKIEAINNNTQKAVNPDNPVDVNSIYARYDYKYNGKEFQDELGLGLYDYGARNYDPALGRWMNIDPLAEEFYSLSPYNYVANDPVGLADLDGRDFRINIMRNDEGEITGINFSATVYIKGDGASKERALELDKEFIDNFGSKEVDGIDISVSVSYVYNEDITQDDLGAGENILEFKSEEGRSFVDGIKDSNGNLLTGNTGTIFGSGKRNNTVFHETFHFMGLSDRYDDFNECHYCQFQGTTPNAGFEKDIMGNSSYLKLDKYHYQQWYEHAKMRSKGYGNQFGSEAMSSNQKVDVNSNGNVKTPYEKGGVHIPHRSSNAAR